MKKYGGFWKRVLAYIIDTFVIYIPFRMIPGIDMNDTWVNVIMIVAWTAYFVWMVGAYGATIGKMVVKLKIVKETENASPIPMHYCGNSPAIYLSLYWESDTSLSAGIPRSRDGTTKSPKRS